jgi:hypothetical protein
MQTHFLIHPALDWTGGPIILVVLMVALLVSLLVVLVISYIDSNPIALLVILDVVKLLPLHRVALYRVATISLIINRFM